MTPAEKQEVIWMFLDQGLSYKERNCRKNRHSLWNSIYACKTEARA